MGWLIGQRLLGREGPVLFRQAGSIVVQQHFPKAIGYDGFRRAPKLPTSDSIVLPGGKLTQQ